MDLDKLRGIFLGGNGGAVRNDKVDHGSDYVTQEDGFVQEFTSAEDAQNFLDNLILEKFGHLCNINVFYNIYVNNAHPLDEKGQPLKANEFAQKLDDIWFNMLNLFRLDIQQGNIAGLRNERLLSLIERKVFDRNTKSARHSFSLTLNDHNKDLNSGYLKALSLLQEGNVGDAKDAFKRGFVIPLANDKRAQMICDDSFKELVDQGYLDMYYNIGFLSNRISRITEMSYCDEANPNSSM